MFSVQNGWPSQILPQMYVQGQGLHSVRGVDVESSECMWMIFGYVMIWYDMFQYHLEQKMKSVTHMYQSKHITCFLCRMGDLAKICHKCMFKDRVASILYRGLMWKVVNDSIWFLDMLWYVWMVYHGDSWCRGMGHPRQPLRGCTWRRRSSSRNWWTSSSSFSNLAVYKLGVENAWKCNAMIKNAWVWLTFEWLWSLEMWVSQVLFLHL